jgi:3'(2'), 5'-bisphosphate nucleotidase
MDTLWEADARLAARIAREAADIVLDFYRRGAKVKFKPGDEPVTEADQAASAFIVAELRRERPADTIISEEAEDDQLRRTADRVWFIDPIDGTKEFIAKNGEFSIMIGLCVDGQAVVGAVYQPTADRLWYATPDGAFVEHKGEKRALRVSSHNEFLAFSMISSRSHRNFVLMEARKRLGIPREITSGSGGIKLGLIAEREADVMFSPSSNSKLWDMCAPEAILRAAGGEVTDFQGQRLDYRREELRNLNGVVASNGTRHADIIALVRDLFPRPAAAGQ